MKYNAVDTCKVCSRLDSFSQILKGIKYITVKIFIVAALYFCILPTEDDFKSVNINDCLPLLYQTEIPICVAMYFLQ